MKTCNTALITILILSTFTAGHVFADDALSISEFRKMYDGILAGKTLETESRENGTVVRKVKKYGEAINTGGGEFDIPVSLTVTSLTDGKRDSRITVEIIDRVNDLGGQVIIQEEITAISVVETGDEKPEEAVGTEFGGIYRVSKSEKGGFDVQNFSLTPSVKIEGDDISLAGSMIKYSCHADGKKSVCDLTVRDYELGEYEDYKGFIIGEAIGGDFTESYVSSEKN